MREIFARAQEKRGGGRAELQDFLLEESGKKNYIPAGMEGTYARALLLAFEKESGEAMEEDSPGLRVRILGGGCVNCRDLERQTLSALAELNLAADFAKEEDPGRIARFGVRGIPALVIGGKVKCAGRVPPREEIKKWLREEAPGGSAPVGEGKGAHKIHDRRGE